jgi:hypothetical protein
LPKFSAFNPFGALRFSSRPSHGEKFYREIVKALGNGKNYTTDFNSLAMARVYAQSMAFGRCQYTLERAGSQFRPSRALELLPALEKEYGLVPDSTASIGERRAELAIAAWIARGGRRSNVEAILTELFGAAFVTYVTIPTANAVISPTNAATRGVYAAPGSPRAAFRTSVAVSRTGTTVTISAQLLAGTGAVPEPGSRVVIDPGDPGRVEAVSVISATLAGATLSLTATFAHAHNAGVILATGRHPNLVSTKRRNLFLLSPAAVRDNANRRRLNKAAHRLVRAVSTWSMTDGSGPFRVGHGRLGITTIGIVT